MDKIWWEQITRASRLLRTVSDTMLGGKSVILSLPPSIPWYRTMYSRIEELLHQGNPNNCLQEFSCPPGNVGEFLFETYCKQEKRASYRRGMSYAAFLAKSEDLVLNDRYLWVRDVSGEKLEEWSRFLVEYYKNLPEGMPPAVFLLETVEGEQPRKAVKGVQSIRFSDEVDAYDRFAFCALACTEGGVPIVLRPYLAELVSTLCQDDVELCAACIQRGQSFLTDPEGVLNDIARRKTRSNGETFDIAPMLAGLKGRLWESQLKLIFPVLQQYSAEFIQQHEKEIRAALPLTTSYGETIDDPQDAELGLLVYLVGSQQLGLSGPEHKQLVLFRNARNSLAHMRPLDFSNVEKILRF